MIGSATNKTIIMGVGSTGLHLNNVSNVLLTLLIVENHSSYSMMLLLLLLLSC